MRAPHVSSSFPIAIPYRLSYRHHYCHPQISHASHHNHHPNQHPPQNPYRRPQIPTPNPNPKSGRFRCSIRASRSSNPNPKSQPQIWQVQIFNSGVSQLLAMAASNEALRYVSFPTQVLGKSCKMVPVMAGGILLGGKKYSLSAYIQVRDQMRRGGGGAGGCAARLDALVDSPCRPLSTPILTLTLNPQLSPPTPTPNSHPQLSPLTPTFSHSPRWRSSPLASVCSISAARPNRAAPTPLTASSSSASHL